VIKTPTKSLSDRPARLQSAKSRTFLSQLSVQQQKSSVKNQSTVLSPPHAGISSLQLPLQTQAQIAPSTSAEDMDRSKHNQQHHHHPGTRGGVGFGSPWGVESANSSSPYSSSAYQPSCSPLTHHMVPLEANITLDFTPPACWTRRPFGTTRRRRRQDESDHPGRNSDSTGKLSPLMPSSYGTSKGNGNGNSRHMAGPPRSADANGGEYYHVSTSFAAAGVIVHCPSTAEKLKLVCFGLERIRVLFIRETAPTERETNSDKLSAGFKPVSASNMQVATIDIPCANSSPPVSPSAALFHRDDADATKENVDVDVAEQVVLLKLPFPCRKVEILILSKRQDFVGIFSIIPYSSEVRTSAQSTPRGSPIQALKC
jgi:hypothetical protein